MAFPSQEEADLLERVERLQPENGLEDIPALITQLILSSCPNEARKKILQDQCDEICGDIISTQYKLRRVLKKIKSCDSSNAVTHTKYRLKTARCQLHFYEVKQYLIHCIKNVHSDIEHLNKALQYTEFVKQLTLRDDTARLLSKEARVLKFNYDRQIRAADERKKKEELITFLCTPQTTATNFVNTLGGITAYKQLKQDTMCSLSRCNCDDTTNIQTHARTIVDFIIIEQQLLKENSHLLPIT